MKKKKAFSLKYGEVDAILDLVFSHANANRREKLVAVIEQLAEQPREILCRNPVWAAEVGRDGDGFFQMYQKPWANVRPSMSDAKEYPPFHFNELELASDLLLRQIYLLLDPDGTLAENWGKQGHHLEATLYAWLNQRDGPVAERTRRNQREGGKQASRNLQLARQLKLKATAAEHEKILKAAECLKRQNENPREFASRLGLQFKRSPHQIRRILSKNHTKDQS